MNFSTFSCVEKAFSFTLGVQPALELNYRLLSISLDKNERNWTKLLQGTLYFSFSPQLWNE